MPAMIAVLLALGVLLMLGLAFRRSARSRRMLRKLNQKFEEGQKIEEMMEEIIEEEIEDLAQRSAGAASPADAKTWQFELPDIDLALVEAALVGASSACPIDACTTAKVIYETFFPGSTWESYLVFWVYFFLLAPKNTKSPTSNT